MKNLIAKMIAAMFLFSSISVFAATTPDTNKDDGSNLGTSDTPQIKQQQKRIDKKSMSKKHSTNKSMNKNQMMESNKKMDTNSDGMISRDEYMAHQEMMYGNFKQDDSGNGVSLNEMNNYYMENAGSGGLTGKTRRNSDGAMK